MGSGKTSYIMNEINKASTSQKFIYVAPTLEETDRIVSICPNMNFYQPKDRFGTKSTDLVDAIKNKKNIAMTHALFTTFVLTANLIETIRETGYILVVDETIDMVSNAKISTADFKMLLDTKKIEVLDCGLLRWVEENYVGKHEQFRSDVKRNNTYCFHNTPLQIIPIEKITAFSKVIILTYLFDGCPMSLYIKSYGLTFESFHIYKNELVNGKSSFLAERKICRDLVDVHSGNLNFEKQSDSFLSYSYCKDKKRATPENLKQIKNNNYNFLRNHCNSLADDVRWTAFIMIKDKIAPQSYKSSFLPCNARATNAFSHCNSLAYLVNVYCNPQIKSWFTEKDQHLSDDAFALSQMLQWIWRSAIRNQQPTNIYIPSRRMRNLLLDWLNGIDIEKPQ